MSALRVVGETAVSICNKAVSICALSRVSQGTVHGLQNVLCSVFARIVQAADNRCVSRCSNVAVEFEAILTGRELEDIAVVKGSESRCADRDKLNAFIVCRAD